MNSSDQIRVSEAAASKLSAAPIDETPVGQAIRKRIAVSERFSSLGPVDKVLADLELLAEVDRSIEAKQKFWSWWGWTTGAMTIIFCFLAVPTFGITLVIGLPSLIAFIFVQTKYYGLAKINVEDRRYRVPKKLLTQLRPDIPPMAKIELNIQVAKYNSQKFLKKKEGSFLGSVSTYRYEVPWLSLKGVFMDGTKFRLRVTANVKRKEKRKRKSTKITENYREKYNLLIVVSPNRYTGLEQFQQLLQNARVGSQVTVSSSTVPVVKVDGNRIIVQSSGASYRHFGINTATHDPFRGRTAGDLVQQFQLVYRALEECRMFGGTDSPSRQGNDVQPE